MTIVALISHPSTAMNFTTDESLCYFDLMANKHYKHVVKCLQSLLLCKMSTLVNSVYITSAFLCFYLTALLLTSIPAYIHCAWSQLAELVQWVVWACQCSHQRQGLEFCHSNLEQCVYLAFCFLCLLCLLTRFLSLMLNNTSWPCCSDTYIFVTIRTFHSCVGIIFDFFQFLFILSSLLIFQYDNTWVSNLPHLSFSHISYL